MFDELTVRMVYRTKVSDVVSLASEKRGWWKGGRRRMKEIKLKGEDTLRESILLVEDGNSAMTYVGFHGQ